MTWLRRIQSGFELRDVNELDQYVGKGSATGSINTTSGQYYTGNASLNLAGGVRPRGKTLPGSDKLSIRSNCFLRHGGTGTGDEGIIFLITGSSEILLSYDSDDNLVRLKVGGSTVASDTPGNFGIPTTGVWYGIGIHVYRDASAGVVSVYVGGVQKLTYAGNTGTYTNGVFIGGEESANAWITPTTIDDFYFDYSTSSEVDLPPPSYRYDMIRPTADGTPTDWVCSTGSDNYANVDDTTPDDDSTYNSATAIDVVDEYALTDYTLATGYVISSVIPLARAKKTSAVTDAQIALGLDQGGTEEYGSGQSIGTTYGYIFDRFTDDPNNNAWTDARVDSIKLQVKSTGTF